MGTHRKNNAFNYRFGPDPDNWADVESNELMVIIQIENERAARAPLSRFLFG